MFPILLYGLKKYDERSTYHVLSGHKHTYYRVTYQHTCSLNDEITALYNRFYKSLNPFDPDSTISKINNNREVVLDDIFVEAFRRSMELAERTNGMFDPTCAPLINRWGFGFGEGSETISEIKEYVGYEMVDIRNGSIQKADPRVQLNFSAIGDGFACDIIARYLDKEGVENYMVDIGGEIISKGKNKTGSDWTVGIIKPPKELVKEQVTQFETILHMQGRTALATSGNYNNFKVKNGKRYGHSINPLTGYPTHNQILSATVITADGTTADAYATAIMSVEKDRLEELLKTDPSLDYYIIYKTTSSNYGIKQSQGMKKYTR